MIIRKAKLKDVKSCALLERDMLKFHANFDPIFTVGKGALQAWEKQMRSHVYDPKKLLLVAEDKGKIVAMASGRIKKYPPVFKEKHYGHVGAIFVKEEYRRKGLAGELLKEIENWFKEKKLKYAELNVAEGNEYGKKAWEKYGYKDVLHLRRKTL